MKHYPCPHFNYDTSSAYDLQYGILADVGTSDDGETQMVELRPRCADIVRVQVLINLIQPAIQKGVNEWAKSMKINWTKPL